LVNVPVARIDLQKVVDGDETTILHFRQLLSIRGWCFVEVPLALPKIAKSTLERAEEFFKLTNEEKSKYKLPTNFGYVSNKSKQVYRALTGPLLVELDLPEQLKDCITALAFKLDQMCLQIIDKISVPFFGRQLNPSNNNLTLLAKAKYSGYGMLDIVEYFNNDDNDLIDKKTVVDSHGDPGLFSISLGSTNPGLSMRDPVTKQWIHVPIDKCVLWCGSAAQELMNYSDSANLGLLQVGMHRVEKSENGPRRTLWYEVCTKYQVPKAIHFYGMKATPPVVDPQTDSVVRVNMKTLMGEIVVLELRGSDVVYKMKELMQDKKGFPPEKQRLFVKSIGRVPLDEMTLNECGIKDGDDVYQILALRS
jgi:ubiquitin-like protein Nedd8